MKTENKLSNEKRSKYDECDIYRKRAKHERREASKMKKKDVPRKNLTL